MDIDSVGTFTMCHEALEYLKKGGQGRNSSSGGMILNISATLHYTASWYQIHVSAAKAAVDALTRNLALESGTDYDIRVNGIAPGPIGDTTGMRKLVPDEMNSKSRDYMPLYKVGYCHGSSLPGIRSWFVSVPYPLYFLSLQMI
ncbi:hypothetical protein Leryth_023568 [Lithospermum erythrorhizon]|nr:hypothetical protein Leryth_023568 [Lithospermum erythrorhizon]